MNQQTIDKILRGLSVGVNIRPLGNTTPNELKLVADIFEVCSKAQAELIRIWTTAAVHQDRLEVEEAKIKARLATEDFHNEKHKSYLKEVSSRGNLPANFDLLKEISSEGIFDNLDDVHYDDAAQPPAKSTPSRSVTPPYGTYGCWDYPNKDWTKIPTENDAKEVCRQKRQRDTKSDLWKDVTATKDWFKKKGWI